MANITIDGVRLTVPDDQNVLESALQAGIYIPHLCYHPDLPENGSCRMCIVEVDGEEQPVPSCTLRPKDGMVIRTRSERVDKLRVLALELLLAAHPEDCSTCPKYGNCELQTLMQYVGANASRMRVRIKGARMEEGNPLLIHDMNRCVLCGRCVRACKKLRGVGVLDYTKREDLETFVATVHGKLLKDEDCRFCGACAEVCPTGSIRDKLQAAETGKTKEELTVPCRAACPAHTDVPRYVRFVKQGDYDAALAVIREKAPFPKVLGYICNHVCELDCKRREVNEAMSIRNIKRYAAEHDSGKYWRGKGKQLPDTGKKVCVVGGGPAGMEAALILTKRGHEVTLYEKEARLGGLLNAMDGIEIKWTVTKFKNYLIRQVEKAGIRVLLNTQATPELLKSEGYDEIFAALGSSPIIPPIPGADRPNVCPSVDVVTKEADMGHNVVVIGGGDIGVEMGIHLARKGHEVTVIEMLDKLAPEAVPVHFRSMFEKTWEEQERFSYRLNARVTGIDESAVRYQDQEGNEHSVPADSVVIAAGMRARLPEAQSFYSLGCRVRFIGDCFKVGSIQTAMRTAYSQANQA